MIELQAADGCPMTATSPAGGGASSSSAIAISHTDGVDSGGDDNFEWAWQKLLHNVDTTADIVGRPRIDRPANESILRRNYNHYRIPSAAGSGGMNMKRRPKIVSIGPYFRNTPCLVITDEIKWGLMRHLFMFERVEEDAHALFKECIKLIVDEEQQWREYYTSHVVMDTRDFVAMLLLDGCFIIYIMIMTAVYEESQEIVWPSNILTENATVTFVIPYSYKIRADLVMFGNQIPFTILQELWLHLRKQNEVPFEKLGSYIWPLKGVYFPTVPGTWWHLLHLFHDDLFPSDMGNQIHEDTLWIPSATELQELGIKFVVKKGSYHLLDIRFDNKKLHIPFLSISDHVRDAFQDLVDFEQYYVHIQPHTVTYAQFMNNLLRRPADVRLLSVNGIIDNRLASDEDVIHFFNDICARTDFQGGYLVQLYEDINKYRESKWHKWKAEMVRKYFSSPLVFISVGGAFILLLLAALQTFYTVFANYKPRN